jgi:hypothetical protein
MEFLLSLTHFATPTFWGPFTMTGAFQAGVCEPEPTFERKSGLTFCR